MFEHSAKRRTTRIVPVMRGVGSVANTRKCPIEVSEWRSAGGESLNRRSS